MIQRLTRALPHPIISPQLRKNAGAALIDNFFRGLSMVGRLGPRGKPENFGIRHIADIPYLSTANPAHTLDLFIPSRGHGPYPVVFYAHGGGFRILSKDTHFGMAMQFARRGYLVVNINYRLSGEARFPAGIADACHAYKWMTENIAHFGGDLSRLVLAGESAGANLVCGLTIAACYKRDETFARTVFQTGVTPRITAAACGMLQVTGIDRFTSQPRVSRFVADRLEEVSASYIDADLVKNGGALLDFVDPLLFFERQEAPERALPAFFMPVGTKDVLLDDTRRMGAALSAMGVANLTRYYPGELHAFHAFVWREQAKACWGHQFDFLEQYLR